MASDMLPYFYKILIGHSLWFTPTLLQALSSLPYLLDVQSNVYSCQVGLNKLPHIRCLLTHYGGTFLAVPDLSFNL